MRIMSTKIPTTSYTTIKVCSYAFYVPVHYHHPYYVSDKKKQMKQTYCCHPKQPNKSRSNASQGNCNPTFKIICKSLMCPCISTAPHGEWSWWHEKRWRHNKNQWSKTDSARAVSKVGKGQNKCIYGTITASQTGTVCLWYTYVPLVSKGLTVKNVNTRNVGFSKTKNAVLAEHLAQKVALYIDVDKLDKLHYLRAIVHT